MRRMFVDPAKLPETSTSDSKGAACGWEATPPGSSGNQPAVVQLFPWQWRSVRCCYAPKRSNAIHTVGGGVPRRSRCRVEGKGNTGGIGCWGRKEQSGRGTLLHKRPNEHVGQLYLWNYWRSSTEQLMIPPVCSHMLCGYVGICRRTHTHTHLRDTFCIIKGYLKVILNRNCHTSIIRTSSPLMLQLTFISLSFGYTHTHRNSSSRWNTRGFFSI